MFTICQRAAAADVTNGSNPVITVIHLACNPMRIDPVSYSFGQNTYITSSILMMMMFESHASLRLFHAYYDG